MRLAAAVATIATARHVAGPCHVTGDRVDQVKTDHEYVGNYTVCRKVDDGVTSVSHSAE